MSELDQLRAFGDRIVSPSFELLQDIARRQARRNRIAGAIGTAAAVSAVVAVTSALLSGTDGRKTPEPLGPPYDVNSTHPVTYALGSTVQYGAQTFTTPAPVVELDMTDAGVVARTADGSIWFANSESLDRVGKLGEPGAAYGEPGSAYAYVDHPWGTSGGFVVTENTGALAAWLEFPQPGQPELVVYDTEHAAETDRLPLGVEPGDYALLDSVSDDYAYWYPSPESIEDEPFPGRRTDLDSGAVETVTAEMYAAERPGPGTPRTMMITPAEDGDTPTVVDATARQFDVISGRVMPMGAQPQRGQNGATGQRFAFDAPEGYPKVGLGWLSRWFAHDAVVIVQRRGGKDLLVCRHSTGACTLAERLPGTAVLPETD